MENQEADQKFGSCPWVSNRFGLCVDSVAGSTARELIALGDGVNVDHHNSWRLDKWGRVWEWLA